MRWRDYHSRSRRQTSFRLRDTRLCMGCEVLFEADACPVCGSEAFVPVSKWIKPLQPAAQEREAHSSATGSPGKSVRQPDGPVSLLSQYLHRMRVRG